MIFSLVLIDDLKIALIGLIVALLLVFISRVPLRFVLGQLKWIALFTLSFFVIMPFTVPGSEITRLYSLSISYEGLRYASLISLRAFAATLLIFPIFSTMKFDQTIKAFDKLKVPNKLVQMFMFTYRYIFVLSDELDRTLMSLESRGFKMRTNMHTMKTIGKGIGMLLVKSWERAERVYNAMIARGYSGNLKTLSEFKMGTKDLLKAFLIIVVAIMLHGIRFIGAV